MFGPAVARYHILTRYDVETGGEIIRPHRRFNAGGRTKNAGDRQLFHAENLVIRPGTEVLDGAGALTHIRRCWQSIQASQEQRKEEKTKPADDHDIGQATHHPPYSGKIAASQVRFDVHSMTLRRCPSACNTSLVIDNFGRSANVLFITPLMFQLAA